MRATPLKQLVVVVGGSDFRHILGWSLEKYPTTTVEDADDNVDNDDGVS